MKHTIKASDCMFMVPHELTGVGSTCALFKDVCNKFGTRCVGYEKHTAESRKVLEDLLEKRRKEVTK